MRGSLELVLVQPNSWGILGLAWPSTAVVQLWSKHECCMCALYPLTHIKIPITSSYSGPYIVLNTTNTMFLQRFIRNDATRTDPPEIYNLRTVLISLVVGEARVCF